MGWLEDLDRRLSHQPATNAERRPDPKHEAYRARAVELAREARRQRKAMGCCQACGRESRPGLNTCRRCSLKAKHRYESMKAKP